jgi:TonB family protein
LSAGGSSWAADRLAAAKRLRISATIAVVVHLLAFVCIAIALRPRPRPPVRLEGIPIDLVRLTQPPPLGATVRSEKVSLKVLENDGDKNKAVAKVRPAGDEGGRPVPVKKPKKEPPKKIAQQAAVRDTTKAFRSEVAFSGGAEGALEIGAIGELSAYAYYLQAVRDKIATCWAPPSGLSTGNREVSATVSFQIDRRGSIGASYVEEPSGTGVFDAAALRAVVMANPLPPLPQDFPGDWVGIHLRFIYEN